MNEKDGAGSCEYTKLQVQLAAGILANTHITTVFLTESRPLEECVASMSLDILEKIINQASAGD